MAPLIVLIVASATLWLAGRLGATIFQLPGTVLRTVLAVMFLITASAPGQETARSDPNGATGFSPS